MGKIVEKHEKSVTDLRDRVYIIRGEQVMLDQDLAYIYGYEVKRLNEQVKRNINRFPDDFMFQLLPEEIPKCLKSQFATLNESGNKRGLHMKKMPYAFTEQGIYMLATVLKGELAEQQSIFIMRAFRELRHYFQQNQQFATKSEVELLSVQVMNHSVRIDSLNDSAIRAEHKIEMLQKSINVLSENFITEKDLKSYVIYRGQKFEADKAYIDIYTQAKHNIFVIDDYVNVKTLQLLSHKDEGVDVVLFTQNGHGKKGFLTAPEVDDFNVQYPSLRLKPNNDCHDRFIVLDYDTDSEMVFHCGASSKDAGKKVCAINKLDKSELIHPIIEQLLQGSDTVL